MDTTQPGPSPLPADQVEDVRLSIYSGFASTGLAPSAVALADATGLTTRQIEEACDVLSEHRDIVLDPDGRIVMAHPFSSVPLGFSVMGARTLWWGGCAWDSFAIPHLLSGESAVLVATRCPGCGTAHAWSVGTNAPPAGDQVAHFLTPTSHIWDDVVRSCGNQRLFCSTECVEHWLTDTGQARGYVMDLAALWRLASDWYTGRLDRGYQRREPAAAAAYFAWAGLRGPFWGLTD
ncbi:MAG: organomercurial lyase [Streptosporangiaceae bacterium]